MECMGRLLSGYVGWEDRKKATRMMKGDGAALMCCGGDDGGRSKEG
jgi:hypothetical protein